MLSDDVGPGHESAQPVMDSDGPQERKSSGGEGDEDGEAGEETGRAKRRRQRSQEAGLQLRK